MTMEKLKKEEDEIDSVKARTVLWVLVFFGFAVNYMIRINLNIAIVDMVRSKPKNLSLQQSQDCQPNILHNSALLRLDNTHPNISQNFSEAEDHYSTLRTSTIPSNILRSTLQTESSSLSEEYVEQASMYDEDTSKFTWNEYHQGLVLGAFFWLHWLTQVPGGILAGKYGTKLVFGVSNFAGVLCCFAIPTAAYMGYKELIAIRLFQGLVSGFCWPAMHNMTAKWIPPNERSKFVTAYLGSSVGAALTFPMCGVIMDYWGWELVFHVSGVLGTVWFVLWWLFVFDSPVEHPRIESAERDYIVASLGQSVSKDKAPVPWRSIFTSVPVWMNILAQWGGIWGLFTLMTHAPTYFKFIHGVNIKMNGFLSGLPHLLRMIFAFIFSMFGDFLLRTNKMSRTNVRKLATAVCCIGQGFCMLALAYSGCSYHSAIVFLTMATAIHGAVSTGPLASVVDISPNYASIILGLCNTVVAIVGFLTPTVVGVLTYQNGPVMLTGDNWNRYTICVGVILGVIGTIAIMPGFIAPIIVGSLTVNNQTVGQWQKVFWISTCMLMVAGLMYILFSNSELQTWNSPGTSKNAALDEEMQYLKPMTDKEKQLLENNDDEEDSPPEGENKKTEKEKLQETIEN